MPLARTSAILLGALLSITPATANPAPGPVADIPPAPAPGPDGARAPAGGQVHHGGVGFGAPHRQDQLAVVKLLLEVGDDEWKTLAPKVENVIAAKLNMSTGAGMNWTSSNNAKPTFQASTAKPNTAPGHAMQDVRAAVAAPEPSDEHLLKRMAALREARQKARAEYETAQKELIEALKPRQQAILMTLGVIE